VAVGEPAAGSPPKSAKTGWSCKEKRQSPPNIKKLVLLIETGKAENLLKVNSFFELKVDASRV
jgi:hypothetical protein